MVDGGGGGYRWEGDFWELFGGVVLLSKGEVTLAVVVLLDLLVTDLM